MRSLYTAFLATLCLLVAGPAFAVDELGLFELDGNAVESDNAGDDWATLYDDCPTGNSDCGSANVFTGVTADPAPASIFNGGRKDIQDIDQWGWKDGAVPDKGDITNAYAAAYDYNGDLIVYFGADRVANSGDTFLGFWFFKSAVTRLPDGSFEGLHEPGDTLVLVNFPQASNAVPLIQVVEWDPDCKKAAQNPVAGNQAPTGCAAANLLLKAGVEGAGAICSTSVSDQLACAIANEEFTPNAYPGADATAPWTYLAKDGTNGAFPYETFFEGGINLTALIGGDACFSSFMAETRSSSSFTASLKDFVLDAFPVCSISVTKACTNPRLNSTEDKIIYDITGKVINDGSGTIYNIGVTDSPAFDPGSLAFNGDHGRLAGGASIDYSATITVLLTENGTKDTVTATANTSSDNSGTVLTAKHTATCTELQISPALSLSKNCASSITVMDAKVVARVTASGEVCNIGDTRVDNVSVVDDKAGTLLAGVSLVAPADPDDPGSTAGACAPYTGTYMPQEANDSDGNPTNDPTAVIFKDSASASGEDIFGADVIPQPVMAECPLCPECPDCPE